MWPSATCLKIPIFFPFPCAAHAARCPLHARFLADLHDVVFSFELETQRFLHVVPSISSLHFVRTLSSTPSHRPVLFHSRAPHPPCIRDPRPPPNSQPCVTAQLHAHHLAFFPAFARQAACCHAPSSAFDPPPRPMALCSCNARMPSRVCFMHAEIDQLAVCCCNRSNITSGLL